MMTITYHGHTSDFVFPGYATIVSESRRGEPSDSPIEWQTSLTVKFTIMESSAGDYHDNRVVVKQIDDFVKANPQGRLEWVNAENAATYLNPSANPVGMPVTISSTSLPEDPNATGTFRMEYQVTFEYKEPIFETSTSRLTLSFQRVPQPALTLQTVTKWKEDFSSSRFSPYHSVRSQTIGRITASGKYLTSPQYSLTLRRANLESLKRRWMNEMNGRDGLLKYGSYFNNTTGRTVKIDEFNADIDDAFESISWSFTASFVAFPNGASWAICEYDSNVTENKETGDIDLTFSGKIASSDYNTAIAKLAAMRSSLLESLGYTVSGIMVGRTIKQNKTSRLVSSGPATAGVSSTGAADTYAANQDDTTANTPTFLELSFSEDYTRKSSTVLSWDVKTSDTEDIKSGQRTISYSGYVNAGGATYQAAYTTARAKAESLGIKVAGAAFPEIKPYQFLVSSNYSAEYKKNEGTGAYESSAQELVQLQFSFNYQRKTSRVYFEISSSDAIEYLGERTVSVSGSIIANTNTAAENLLYELTAEYATYGIRSLSKTQSQINIANAADDPGIDSGASPVAEVEQTILTSKYTRQYQKLDFGFQAVVPITSLDFITLRFEIESSRDLVSLTNTTRISGMVFARSFEAAQVHIGFWDSKTPSYDMLPNDPADYTGKLKEWKDTYAGSGSVTGYSLSRVKEHLPGGVGLRTPAVSAFDRSGFTFSITFEDRITGQTAILDCELNEQNTYTGYRQVEQMLPDQASEIQQCGKTCGSRTLSGSVTAATETAAMSWIKRLFSSVAVPTTSMHTIDLPFYSDATPTTYAQPPQTSTSFKWVPRFFSSSDTADLERGEDCRVVVVSFTFSELIPDYPLNL